MPSLLVIHYETTTGKYYAQKVGSAQVSDYAIISGKIASGGVGVSELIADKIVTSAKLTSALISILGTVADGGITSAKIDSGIVGSVHLADEAVKSGDIGANVIATPHILNQGLLSASIGATVIGTPHIKDANITSAKIGSGAIGDALVAAYGVVSGKYASGSIFEPALASGISIDIAELAQEPSFRAADLISGYLGIQFSVSGYFNHAQAAAVNTMPAVGVTIANILSGQVGVFQHLGRLTNAAWDFSGHIGEMLFIGTSSQMTLTAPSASGECVQRAGKVIDPTKVFLRPELQFIQVGE